MSDPVSFWIHAVGSCSLLVALLNHAATEACKANKRRDSTKKAAAPTTMSSTWTAPMAMHDEGDRENFLSIRGGGKTTGGDRDVVLRARCKVNLRKLGKGVDFLAKAGLFYRFVKKAVNKATLSPAAVARQHFGVSLAPPASSAKYDYVVVGAGAAGCALAARLSEDANVSVLLLEAGEDLGSFKHAVPSLAAQPALRGLSDADWRFEADLGAGPPPPPPISTTTTHTNPADLSGMDMVELQKLMASMGGGAGALPGGGMPGMGASPTTTTSSRGTTVLSRGKALGGTAALANLLHVRGDPAAFDAWAAEEGCDGWGYLDMVPYFKRSEAARVYGDSVGVRGAGGPVPVRPAASWNDLHPCTKHFLARANDALAADAHVISTAAAAVAADDDDGSTSTVGTARIAAAAAAAAHVAPRFREDAAYDAASASDSAANTFDYNGAVHVGAGVAQVTANNGRRCDPAWAYLTPSVLVRPNLHVATGSRATRVIFEGDRATGVRYCCPTAGGGSGGGGATAGPEHSVLATREVLLCAGAVGTPWLLLLSGVGPRQDLADKGVPVVADLEGVGANLVTPAAVPCYFPVLPKGEGATKEQKARCKTRTGAVRRAHRSWRNPLYLPLKAWQVARYVWQGGRGGAGGGGGALARPPVEALVHCRSDRARTTSSYAAAATPATAVAAAATAARLQDAHRKFHTAHRQRWAEEEVHHRAAVAGAGDGGASSDPPPPLVDNDTDSSDDDDTDAPAPAPGAALRRGGGGPALLRQPPADLQLAFSPFLPSAEAVKQQPARGGLAAAVDSRVLQAHDGCTVVVALSQPRSRGCVKLVSTDPLRPPEIRLNLLAEKIDRDTMVGGVRLARDIMGEEYRIVPGVSEYEDEFGGGIRGEFDEAEHSASVVVCTHAAAGTCRMGARGSRGAVVDHQLRVHGLRAIRVVGSAVAPRCLSGGAHSAAATTAMAERAADIVKGARVSEEGERIALRRREEEAACGGGGGGVPRVRLEAPRNNLISESLSQFSRNFKAQSVTLQPQTPSPSSDVGVAINRGGDAGISGSSSGGGGGGGGMSSSMWDNLSPPSSPESADAARRGAASPPSTFGNTTSFATATSGDGGDHWDLVEDSEVF